MRLKMLSSSRWNPKHLFLILVLLLLMPAVYMQRSFSVPRYFDVEVVIPKQSDWIDQGEIFGLGEVGEWDFQQYGGFANSILKRDGVFYLYYQGARGYRVVPDETVTWRAIGVASSPDGINFTKYEGNPILTWFPNDNGEEGAVSSGVALTDDNQIALFYGANTQESASLINADGRLATSEDGFHFVDKGIALNHRDNSLWASGDELFPILAIHHPEKWMVYYFPNKLGQRRQLGVAWGSAPLDLTRSAAVRQGFKPVIAWGTAGSAQIGPGTYALFLNNVNTRTTEVRLMSVKSPQKLSEPIATYQFDHVTQATFLLDEKSHTWFMYYRRTDGYGVMLAPAGEPDTTPPSFPAEINVESLNHKQVKLTWKPAADGETGVASYELFRDGCAVAIVNGWQFIDENLEEGTEYSYEIAATNYHGVTGARSPAVLVKTPPDTTSPDLVSANASGSPEMVNIQFDEPVDPVTAKDPENYQIDQGIIVTQATLAPDQQKVILHTSPQENGKTYRITVQNLRDQASNPNPIMSGDRLSYTHSDVTGLVGAWNFDQSVNIGLDTANFGNDGVLRYIDQPGPAPTAGISGRALFFDGFDDQVSLSGSGTLKGVTSGDYSFAVWAWPEGKPAATNNNNTYYTLLARKYNGLYFDARGRFRGQIQLDDGSEIALSSKPVKEERWYHVALALDTGSQLLHLFVDGREVPGSPVSFNGKLIDFGEAPYYIGTSDPLRNRYEFRFAGRLDEVRIFNRALNNAEVQSLYQLSE